MNTAKLNRALCIVIAWMASSSTLDACVKEVAHRVKESSNLRSTALMFATKYSNPKVSYTPDQFKTSEDLLQLAADMDLLDTSILFNYIEAEKFTHSPPKTIHAPDHEGYPRKPNKALFDFPIGFTFAVYPDLNGLTSTTPLLWTRGLHRFREFEKPYGGHIVYMDGHVQYHSIHTDRDQAELEAIFDTPGPASKAVRLLEHVPTDWNETTPLPIQMEAARKRTLINELKPLSIFFGPALLGGFLTTISSRATYPYYKRVLRGAMVFTLIFFITAMLFPAVC